MAPIFPLTLCVPLSSLGVGSAEESDLDECSTRSGPSSGKDSLEPTFFRPPLPRAHSKAAGYTVETEDVKLAPGRHERSTSLQHQSLHGVDRLSLEGSFRIKTNSGLWRPGWVELHGFSLMLFERPYATSVRTVAAVVDLKDPDTRIALIHPEKRVIGVAVSSSTVYFLQGGALPPYFGEWADLLRRKLQCAALGNSLSMSPLG